ncbi:hypothetical protein Tco_0774968 [Tanacetum coccineum]|uniref:Uncharacterized protein n=1 Tax=Tanacetum coccineum TaxID=301880 RepID=A0ABQ4ZT81_9ASTR
MLGKSPNKFYDPFLKAGLGYKNPERLKQAIAAQPKMYDGERLQCTKLTIDSPDYEKISQDVQKELSEEVAEMLNIFESMEKKVNELVEHVNQKTYSYGDVHSQNQDLLMTIFELKEKLKTIDKGNNVNTKFDKSATSEKLLCVTLLDKNIADMAKKLLQTEDQTDRLKLVTSHSTSKNEHTKQQSSNVIARGMYKISKIELHTPVSTTNTLLLNDTGVESSNSVRRPQSNGIKSKIES